MWLLDSNTWIRYMNTAPSPVKAKLRAHPVSEILICDVVKAELHFGAYKSQRVAQNLALLATLVAQFHSLPFDRRAAQIFGEIRADLARKGTPIGPYCTVREVLLV